MASFFGKKTSARMLAFHLATSNLSCTSYSEPVRQDIDPANLRLQCQGENDEKKERNMLIGGLVGAGVAAFTRVSSFAEVAAIFITTVGAGTGIGYLASDKNTVACENEKMQNQVLQRQLNKGPGG